MENKGNLAMNEATEDVVNVAENTDAAAENAVEQIETPAKTYTEEEVNQIVGKKRAIDRAKIQKKADREYGELIEVLKAGTGKQSVGEITDAFKQFYKSKGVNIPEKAGYSAKDIDVLAKADADEIIRGGYEEVVEEMDRLSNVGVDNMTAREKAVFKALAENRVSTERGRELSKIGVTEDVYNSPEFQDFASKFNSKTPIADIYGIYAKTQPKKEFKTMGSMKNSTASADSAVKEHYTFEEAQRFSQKDLDKNPALYEAIKRSMLKWK